MQSMVEPGALEVVQRPDGLADVYLRRGIEACDMPLDGGGVQRAWRAEEVHLVGRYDAAWCELHFDELWEQARRASMSVPERVEECEQAGADSAQAVAELGVLAAGSAEGLEAAQATLEDVSSSVEDIMLAVAELGAAISEKGAE